MAAAGNNPLRRNSALWGTLDLTKQWFQKIYFSSLQESVKIRIHDF